MVVNCKETFVPKGVAVYSATHISVVQGIRNEGSHLIHCVDHSTISVNFEMSTPFILIMHILNNK